MLKENFQISEQSSYMVLFSHSYSDDQREGESVPLKPGIHAVERLNQNTKPSSLVELCSRESFHAYHHLHV